MQRNVVNTTPMAGPHSALIHPPEPTLEETERMREHWRHLLQADAVLARRGPEPTSSPMQGFELLGGGL